jgi:hypothetical protein
MLLGRLDRPTGQPSVNLIFRSRLSCPDLKVAPNGSCNEFAYAAPLCVLAMPSSSRFLRRRNFRNAVTHTHSYLWLRAVESNIFMVPIRGFGCGRIGVTQHRGSLNDGVTLRLRDRWINAMRSLSIVEPCAEGNARSRLSPLHTMCGIDRRGGYETPFSA